MGELLRAGKYDSGKIDTRVCLWFLNRKRDVRGRGGKIGARLGLG